METHSHPIYAFSDRLVDGLAELFPTRATYLGIAGFDDRWDDRSPDGSAQVADYLRSALNQLAQLPEPRDRWERRAIRATEQSLADELRFYGDGEYLRDLNNVASPPQDYRDVFDQMPASTAEDWGAIASRLDGLRAALELYRASLEMGRARGTTAARRQVRAVIDQCATIAGDRSYFAGLAQAFEGAGISDDSLARRIGAGATRARAAYGELADYLEASYLPDARPGDAVGTERYVAAARRFLGTTVKPREVYEWGWSEVGRLLERMRIVAGQIEPGASLSETADILKSERAPMAADPEGLAEFAQARLDEAVEHLDGTHFDVPASIREVTVRISPPGGALGAYYVGPSEDFTRRGCVWFTVPDNSPVPLYDQVTTTYHEGFPGHHLQVGTQMATRDHLSRYQRTMMWYSGTGEGWALYAEQLMDDLGYLDRPEYVFGLLTAQMLRACRVVIDIGVHTGLAIPTKQPFHPGEMWSFETAVDMLMEYATLDRAYAESEVTRYLGWPGQAISYKVGERAINEARDAAGRRAGSTFDLKAFHAQVLELGPVGLDLFEELTASAMF
ncbi:MAG: DUF885 domain-containing protein [Acidimicrobiia bacterium]|nr:DUF885 domain-containing protein [Acidimicrobiia bacterium]